MKHFCHQTCDGMKHFCLPLYSGCPLRWGSLCSWTLLICCSLNTSIVAASACCRLTIGGVSVWCLEPIYTLCAVFWSLLTSGRPLSVSIILLPILCCKPCYLDSLVLTVIHMLHLYICVNFKILAVVVYSIFCILSEFTCIHLWLCPIWATCSPFAWWGHPL